jgi:hypothetical protein
MVAKIPRVATDTPSRMIRVTLSSDRGQHQSDSDAIEGGEGSRATSCPDIELSAGAGFRYATFRREHPGQKKQIATLNHLCVWPTVRLRL